jgi:Flp pilus assembly protein TadD
MRILTDAAARDAQNAWAQRSLGASLLNAGRASEAEPYLRQATTLNPNDQQAMFGLG